MQKHNLINENMELKFSYHGVAFLLLAINCDTKKLYMASTVTHRALSDVEFISGARWPIKTCLCVGLMGFFFWPPRAGVFLREQRYAGSRRQNKVWAELEYYASASLSFILFAPRIINSSGF
jgi:hypothetical protein